MRISRRDFTRATAAGVTALLLPTPWLAAQAMLPSGYVDGESFGKRSDRVIEWLLANRPPTRSALSPKAAMAFAAARLLRGVDVDAAVAQIDAMVSLKNLAVDHAFAGHAVLHGYLVGRPRIAPRLANKVRDYLGNWDYATAGFSSLNYKLMTFATGFVSAEQWPAFTDAKGRPAAQVMDVTRVALYREFDQIVRRNLDEYAAPIYFGTDLMAVRMLAEFAADADMQTRARLTFEWMLLNLGCSWNQGYHVATAGRAKYWGSTNTGPDSLALTAAVGWLHYGGGRAVKIASSDPSMSFWLAYPGRHELPVALGRVAAQPGTATPFVYRSSVVVPRSFEVRQTTWHTPAYSLASQFEQTDGPTHHLPKETRRMVLRWVSDRPSSTFIVANENDRRPYRTSDRVANAFADGETPFGQVMQHRGCQLGLFDVPLDRPFYRLYAVFPKGGSILQRIERHGWILCHAGGMLFAFSASAGGTWGKPVEGNDVYWVDTRRGGWALITSSQVQFAGGSVAVELARFADAVCSPQRVAFELAADSPSAHLKTLEQGDLQMTYAHPWAKVRGNHRINGVAIDYKAFPLMGNSWVKQRVDDPHLEIEIDGARVRYDFDQWKREDKATLR